MWASTGLTEDNKVRKDIRRGQKVGVERETGVMQRISLKQFG